MRILLSAYACEPGLGSEAAVGWGWATHLAPHHEVHVITRESNRALIENELNTKPVKNLHFHYYDLPERARKWKKGNRGVHLYYLIWQYGAYRLAQSLLKKHGFDIVHHVTFVSARFPSFMGKLGIPFVFGPVAGGEYSPISLWWSFGWRARIKEILRSASIQWIKRSYLMHKTFNAASHIITTSPQSTSLIPKKHRTKVSEILGIALDDKELAELSTTSSETNKQEGITDNKNFRVFYAGRCLHWKGMELGLKAFEQLTNHIASANLTVIGDGEAKNKWRNISVDIKISTNVQWIRKMSRIEFLESLKQFDVLLFPSLHDSGGMVVLEAMAAGIPVVCLDVGGPALLVDDTCGIKVAVTNQKDTTRLLHMALLELASDAEKCRLKGQAAALRAKNYFTWRRKIEDIETIYKSIIANNNAV